ncbi:(p)ppGpp synthetase I, SpoT/RelA, partial [mine drainage metagenome]
CYGALGVVHTLWKPIPAASRITSMPKGNGYQSLHTTVVGAAGEPMEIQIRTAAMHRTAEEGIAAHWHYKESSAGDPRLDERFSWLRALLEWQKEMLDAERFVENVKLDIFPDEVFVFTPTGSALAAGRVHPGRLRLSDPHRRRTPLPGGQGQLADGRARPPPGERGHRR